MSSEVIRAAGGVVWRSPEDTTGDDTTGDADGSPPPAGDAATGSDGTAEVEVLVVRRPRYDDWSLPKGKLERGEKHKAAALREVLEETGSRCRVDSTLTRISYDTPLGPKNVKWFSMQPLDPAGELGAQDPNEVSEVRWVPFGEAWHLLTYGTERQVLAAFARKVLGVGS